MVCGGVEHPRTPFFRRPPTEMKRTRMISAVEASVSLL